MQGDGVAHIQLSGELDIATTPEVERALSDALETARDAVVDLRCLEFLDSAGVHTLVEATAAARRASRRVLVVPAPPLVHAVFELTGTADGVQTAWQPRAA
jgi:anti-anti-sigma factor